VVTARDLASWYGISLAKAEASIAAVARQDLDRHAGRRPIGEGQLGVRYGKSTTWAREQVDAALREQIERQLWRSPLESPGIALAAFYGVNRDRYWAAHDDVLRADLRLN